MTGLATILRGDARNLPLPDASVDLIVTSPPYYGQRDYRDGDVSLAGQVGAEQTPAEYIAALVGCTREWMRVLKPSGSLFVNLGDKYSQYEGVRKGHGRSLGRAERESRGEPLDMPTSAPTRWGIPAKSLMMLPERYRIACVDHLGLIARSVLIWSKCNGMPESVTDRARRSHEDWVHLTKQARYFSAVDAIREPHTRVDPPRRLGTSNATQRHTSATDNTGWKDHLVAHNPLGRLPGSVWEIATEPLRVPDELGIDHYAAFPTEWPRRLILGWSPSGVCTDCGEGRRPVASSQVMSSTPGNAPSRVIPGVGRDPHARHGGPSSSLRLTHTRAVTGHACACSEPTAPTRPAVVLDPFSGTGTTALVASVLGRHGIGVDRSADYCRLARWRTQDPAQRARAARVPAPEKQSAGQDALFDLPGVAA